MVRAVINHTDQKEEHPGDGSVIEHLQHGAVNALRGKARHAQHHITHVADAGIGDELLEVRLCHRAERAVNDVPRSQCAQKPIRKISGGYGQHGIVDPKDSIGAHLEQHARQYD